MYASIPSVARIVCSTAVPKGNCRSATIRGRSFAGKKMLGRKRNEKIESANTATTLARVSPRC
jgi:hypothetical protein